MVLCSGCSVSGSGLTCLTTELSEVASSLSLYRNLSLPTVFISQSNLSYLPDNVFSPGSEVRELHLVSSNLLSLSDSSLTPLSSSLTFLDLSDNLLSDIPSTLGSLSNLTHLDLSHNLISHLDPDILKHLPRLLHLDLSHNTLHQQSLNLSLTNLHYSLTYLSLAGNNLARFPPMFQQSFPRLETLDLSNNQLTAVPNSLMRQTPRLAKFLIDNNQLVTLMLEPLPRTVRLLSLLANKLGCDCKSLWLRRLLDRPDIELLLSPCFTPFSRTTLSLGSFEGTSLCSLSENDRIPKFFRVTDRDLGHFPSNSFASLKLSEVSPRGAQQLGVKISIQLEFYYNEYDWGVIYREIGSQGVIGENNKFYKTKYNLRDYAGDNFDWSPRSEELEFPVTVSPGPGYYEVCLAVIETGTVYYLHQSLCTEVSLLSVPREMEEDERLELRVNPGVDTATFSWRQTNRTEAVRLTVRQFGEISILVSQLVTSDLSQSLTVSGLRPDTPYTACITSTAGTSETCKEFHSLPDWLSRETAVATTAAVSSSSTMVILFLAWCCCYKRRRRPGDDKDCKGMQLDVNENEREREPCQVKHEAGCVANHSRQWHQKCPDQPLHSRSCSSHQHWPCENTETGSDRDSIVYDCIKSDLQPTEPNTAVRSSSHSLSTKYSENKTHLRKTGSLCVRSVHDQSHQLTESSQLPSQPTDPGRPGPDSAEFLESDLKMNCSGRVVLRKQYGTSQPGQFRSFRGVQPHYRRPVHHLVPYSVLGPDLRRTTSTKEYSRLSRRPKYYPATFSHAPIELRPVKMKKSFKKVGKAESVKMYTWSPYTSSLFYSEPTTVINPPPLIQTADGTITTQDGLQF